ncbi:MAG: transposase [Clostridium sp.]|nr:transposase [Clostridium sp.]
MEHPGGEAQVDFGTFDAYENGTKKKFHELILSFPQSNAGFAVVTRSQTREALFEGLVSIFRFIEYVPTTIWFDQMSTVALRIRDAKGVVKTADAMMRFATHYGFTVRFCNPNSGHEQ